MAENEPPPPPAAHHPPEHSEKPPPLEDPSASSVAEANKGEILKEAVTIIQNESPLETPLSQPLSAALALPLPQDSHSTEKGKIPISLVSFKEESNKISDLSHDERRALDEFKLLVQESLKSRVFLEGLASGSEKSSEEVSIWGVPLLKDERSDVVLLKFLRARDFDVRNAYVMLSSTIKWRRDFRVDQLLKEDLGDDLEKVVFMHGHDKVGHPVCYNVYGEFQNEELYMKIFADEEKRWRFLRWRIQFLEASIRKLDFSPGGINTIFQVSDLMNSPGPGKKELRIATKQALEILQDNYPEFVAKQVFINVPWWYLAFYTMISPFLTQRTKSKFIFSGPTRTAPTLFKYILPEQVPTQYGGLSVDLCECNPEFSMDDSVAEITVKPATKQIVEIIVHEKCSLVWEIRVVGWEVSYSAEFVPQRGYTVLIQKSTKMAANDVPVVHDNFSVSELGKILLTIDNPTSKKKKLLYRFKVAPYGYQS
ncbi:Patellin-3 [Salvia divinorum]|uniref:Patellin-3 n=1 Tax=Salvia divinorum TaxID=28513 RepID=A0ABD1FQL3_SALDI